MMILHQREEDIANLKKDQEIISQKFAEKSSQLNSYHTEISTKENTRKNSQKSLVADKNFISYENQNDGDDQYKNYPARNTVKSQSQNRSPLHENFGILNQQEDYAHTEDSFGEYNNYYAQNKDQSNLKLLIIN